ncbi:MAG: protein kinase [Planctomycetota bacterium]
MMSDSSVHDLIDELADEFLNRKLAGESPAISEYCQRHPKLADEIRNLFATLDLLENIKPEIDRSSAELQQHPTKIGEYRIERVIGRGGMGLVYEAVHESLGRRVALKVMSGRISNDTNAIARFQREARAVAKLHHTNIVPLFEVGEDEGRCYLAMQLISGMSLDRLIGEQIEAQADSQEPWSDQIQSSTDRVNIERPDSGESGPGHRGAADKGAGSDGKRVTDSALVRRHYRWIARIGMQAAEALAYAHHRGVIHRDIKPSNLILEESGVVWLTDFGLAKTDDDALTQTGEFVGTLRYMAPEQLRGDFDERADVYALGATLYELLALRPAFAASDRLQVLDAIHHSSPPSLRELNPRIPRDLETIVMKAMDREPAARYQSAQRMADDIARFVNDEPIRARRLSVVERLLRWQRRNRGLAAALSVTAVLLLLLIGVLSWTSIRQAELRRQADEGREALQRNLYLSQMNVAGQALVQKFGTKTIRARLDEWNPEPGRPDLRNWEWYYLHAVSHRETFMSKPLGNGFCWDCDHSPDGRRVVNTVNGWGIQVRDSEGGQVLRERHLGSARSLDWSPDGRKIAVGQFGDRCTILDAATLETIRELPIPQGMETMCVSWHPDSRWLAEAGGSESPDRRPEVRVHDTETGKLVWTIDAEIAVEAVCWHPTGNWLTCAGEGITKTWNLQKGSPQLESQTQGGHAAWSPDGGVLAVARPWGVWDADDERQLAAPSGVIGWGPEGHQLAVGGSDGAIRIYDAKTSHLLRRLMGHESAISSVSWSLDGRLLATTGLRDETVRIWDLGEADGNQQTVGVRSDHAIRLSADGTHIAAAAAYYPALFLWNISGELLTQHTIPDFGQIREIRADGRRVAYVTSDHEFAIWNADDDTIVRLPTDEPASRFMDSSDWHPAGQLAVGTSGGDIIVWNQDFKEILRIKDAHAAEVIAVNWHPQGRLLATASVDGHLRLWDGVTGKIRWEWQPEQGAPDELRFSRSGEMLAGNYPGVIMLWATTNGEPLAHFDEVRERFQSFDWSPDDSRIVASSPAAITLWDVKSGHVALRIDAPPAIQNVYWSQDGMRIVAGIGGGVAIYDATRGYERCTPRDEN